METYAEHLEHEVKKLEKDNLLLAARQYTQLLEGKVEMLLRRCEELGEQYGDLRAKFEALKEVIHAARVPQIPPFLGAATPLGAENPNWFDEPSTKYSPPPSILGPMAEAERQAKFAASTAGLEQINLMQKNDEDLFGLQEADMDAEILEEMHKKPDKKE